MDPSSGGTRPTYEIGSPWVYVGRVYGEAGSIEPETRRSEIFQIVASSSFGRRSDPTNGYSEGVAASPARTGFQTI